MILKLLCTKYIIYQFLHVDKFMTYDIFLTIKYIYIRRIFFLSIKFQPMKLDVQLNIPHPPNINFANIQSNIENIVIQEDT